MIRSYFSVPGRLQNLITFKVIPDVEVFTTYVWRRLRSEEQSNLQLLESLILAQDERWRRA
jgi:hypothetical protein